MAERSAIGIAMAACLLTTGGVYAQGMAPAGGSAVAPNPYYAPAAAQPMCPVPGPGVAQANLYVDGDGMTTKADYGQAANCDRTPLEEALCRACRNVSVQVDYINWGINRPSVAVIGAQPAPGVLQPDFIPFFEAVTNNATQYFPVTGGFAREYDTSAVNLSNNSGVQGTLSLPMTYGKAELTGFVLARNPSPIDPGGLPQGNSEGSLFAAIGLTSGGVPSDNLLLFSQGFSAQFGSLVFGFEGNAVLNPIFPQEHGFNWSPLIGYRYLGIQERFDIVGLNPGVGSNPNPLVTTINSRTISNLHGPQAGMRFEWVSEYFTIGAEPKVMLGVNQFASTVDSSDPTIGSHSDHVTAVRFAPLGALNVYAKIPIHDQIKIYVAYNLIGTANVARPQNQIVYDETVGGENNIHLAPQSNGILIQGYSIGGEVNF